MNPPPWQKAHDDAVARGDDWYTDPETGRIVMTELSHLKRGVCCRSGCRHCPFGFKKPPITGG